MEYQTAQYAAQNYVYYPYNYCQPSMFNSGFNFFVFPHTDKNVFGTNLSSALTGSSTPQYFSVQGETSQYSSKITQNMVIYKTVHREQEVDSKRTSSKINEVKPKRRVNHLQKENRNVASNLLRIFFKNILEVNAYDQVIEKIMRKFKIEHEIQDFLTWLQKFKINYKNYIKPTQIKKIMGAKNCQNFQKVFIILLKHYMEEIGLTHCLTSKRIERACIKRHLEGLKGLISLADGSSK